MNTRLLAWFVVPVIAVAVWFFSQSTNPSQEPRQASANTPPAGADHPETAGSTPTAHPEKTPAPRAADIPEARPQSPMRGQLQEIAAAYEATSRFPDYSVPLTENDWQLLNPRAFVPRDMPVSAGSDLSATIEVPHYIVDMRHAVPVRVVTTSSSASVNAVSVMLRGTTGGTSTPTALSVSSSAAGTTVFDGMLSSAALASAGAGEALVIANLELGNGEQAGTRAVIEIYESVADLLYLGDAYVDGAHLVIPAHLDVRQPGRFRVQANLYDADSEEPVSHLNASFTLTQGNNVELLKVHAVTLREKQSSGPYRVSDFNIIRSPERPGVARRYGSAKQESYRINGFSLDRYDDTPYVDPAAEQRRAFLEKISQ